MALDNVVAICAVGAIVVGWWAIASPAAANAQPTPEFTEAPPPASDAAASSPKDSPAPAVLEPPPLASIPADPMAAFNVGVMAMQTGDWATATGAFAHCLDLWPAHPDVLALLGISQFHAAHFAEAHAALSQAIDVGTRYAARAMYYDGMSLAELARPEDAKTRFARLLEEFPDSAEARKVLELDATARAFVGNETGSTENAIAPPSTDPLPPESPAAPDPEWSLDVNVSLGFDTNPELASEIQAIENSASRKTDGVFFASLGAEFLPADLPLHARVQGFINEYFTADAVDFFGVVALLVADWQPAPAHLISPSYEFQHLWLATNPYEGQHTFAVEHAWLMAGEMALRSLIGGGFTAHPADFSAFDGGFLSASVSLIWLPEKHGFFRRAGLTASWQLRDAEDSVSDETSFGLNAFATARLADPLSLSLSLGWRYRTFGEEHPSFGIRRTDNRFDARLSARLDLEKWLAVQINARLAVNRANIAAFSYEQFLLELEWVFRF